MNNYKEIYFHNVYEVVLNSQTTFNFSLANLSKHTLFSQPFSIITASNPNNIVLNLEENRLRNKLLYSKLYNEYDIHFAKGCYKEHCEKGFLVLDIPLAKSLALGRVFKQFAIFYCDTKQLRYITCEKEKVIVERKL